MLSVVAGAMPAFTAGLAMAGTKNGSGDVLRGTNKADAPSGGSGDDAFYGFAAAICSSGIPAGTASSAARDDVYGGSGSDYIDDGNDGVGTT